MKNILKEMSVQLLRYAIELLHIFQIFVDDFMSNINCGIRVLHVKRQILTYFCDVISLLAQVFIVSVDRAYKEVSAKKY